jgi:hypothetical protein
MSLSNEFMDNTSLTIEPILSNAYNKKKSRAYLMIENQINVLPSDFFMNIIELENQFTEYNDVSIIHKLINMYKVTTFLY